MLCHQCEKPIHGPYLSDHGQHFHTGKCWAKHCQEIILFPFVQDPFLRLRIFRRRFAGWWGSTKPESIATLIWVILIIFLVLMIDLCAETPITQTVSPKVTAVNPYQDTEFRVIVKIPEHPDNRLLSLGADCGGNAYSSHHEVDRVMWERFYKMRVRGDCIFQACLHRVTNGKVKTFCDPVVVKTGGNNASQSRMDKALPVLRQVLVR